MGLHQRMETKSLSFSKVAKTALISAALLCLLAVAASKLLVWHFEKPPLPKSKMESVRIGMTTEEVVHLLGRPQHTSGLQWIWTRPLAWGEFKVDFDAAGRVKAYDFDN